jgi:hypothetical protein
VRAIEALRSNLTETARLLTGDNTIRVLFEKDCFTAYYRLETNSIHILKPGKLTPQIIRYLNLIVLHECCHARFTNKLVYREKVLKTKNRRHADILNTVEDAMVESQMIDSFPQSAILLESRMAEAHKIAKRLFNLNYKQASIFGILKMLIQNELSYKSASKEEMEIMFNPKRFRIAKTIFEVSILSIVKNKKIYNTRQSYFLATRIYKKIEKVEKKLFDFGN